MRGILGSSCPWKDCNEGITEVRRDTQQALPGVPPGYAPFVARCADGHDSLVSFAAGGTRLTPAPWAPLEPERPTGRDWGLAIGVVLLIVFVIFFLATVGTELPY